MTGRLRRLALAAAVAGAACTGTMLRPVTALAATSPSTACATPSTVAVAVDFGHWGGDVVRGCASHPSSALAAMHAAGFLTAGDQSSGAAFVCRIGLASQGAGSDRPTPGQQACVDTPPANAYWSFWYANRGADHWSYSEQGASSFVPASGSTEAWDFGAGQPPPFTPAQARPTPPTTTTTTVPRATTTTVARTTTTGAPSPPTTASTARRARAATTTTARRARPTATATPPRRHATTTTATTATTTTTTSPSSASTGLRIVNAAPAAHASSSSGGPGGGSAAGLVAGAALVAALAATAAVIGLRRRRAR